MPAAGARLMRGGAGGRGHESRARVPLPAAGERSAPTTPSAPLSPPQRLILPRAGPRTHDRWEGQGTRGTAEWGQGTQVSRGGWRCSSGSRAAGGLQVTAARPATRRARRLPPRRTVHGDALVQEAEVVGGGEGGHKVHAAGRRERDQGFQRCGATLPRRRALQPASPQPQKAAPVLPSPDAHHAARCGRGGPDECRR